MDAENKKYDIQKRENHTLIKVLVEKLDTNIAPALKSELVLIAGNGEKNMIIDLNECRYCDSSGLSAILVGNRLCKGSQGTFVITGVQDAVERLISISQLNQVLNIVPTLEEAVEFLFMEEIERDVNNE